MLGRGSEQSGRRNRHAAIDEEITSRNRCTPMNSLSSNDLAEVSDGGLVAQNFVVERGGSVQAVNTVANTEWTESQRESILAESYRVLADPGCRAAAACGCNQVGHQTLPADGSTGRSRGHRMTALLQAPHGGLEQNNPNPTTFQHAYEDRSAKNSGHYRSQRDTNYAGKITSSLCSGAVSGIVELLRERR